MRSDSNNYLFDNGDVTVRTIAREGHPRLLYGHDYKGNQFQVRFPHGFTVTTHRGEDSIKFVYRAVRGIPLTAQIRVGRVRTVNDVIRTYRKLVNLVFDVKPRLYDLERLGSSNGDLLVPRPGLPPLVRMYHNDQRYKIYDPFQKRAIYVGSTNSPNIKRIVKEKSRELMARINQHRITRRDVFPASLQRSKGNALV